MNLYRSIMLAAVPLAALAAPVSAQEADKFVTIEGNVAFVSDYRFRGVSYSDLDPAVQGGITLSTEPGFYVAGWGSSIADYAGSTMEFDLTVGWAGNFEGLDIGVGATGYFYPGSSDTEVFEFFGTVGYAFGPVGATAGIYWAPDQKNLGTSSRYLVGGLSFAVPETPVTLKGSLGFERGGLVLDESGNGTSKTDWLIGADIAFEPLTVGIAYVGTNFDRDQITGEGGTFRPNRAGRGGVVFSVTAAF